MIENSESTLSRAFSFLEDALRIELPYGYPRPSGGTPSAVLCLLRHLESHFTQPLNNRDWLLSLSVLVIQRAERDGDRHSGQMAFPGGTFETGDTDFIETALRECEEEVGLDRNQIRVVGAMPSLGTPSGFQIHPFLALLDAPGELEPALRLDSLEVASALWIPLAEFLKDGCYSSEFREVGGKKFPIHVYELYGHRIWGATAAMIYNLIERLKALSGDGVL